MIFMKNENKHLLTRKEEKPSQRRRVLFDILFDFSYFAP